jgi:hypothetical protein
MRHMKQTVDVQRARLNRSTQKRKIPGNAGSSRPNAGATGLPIARTLARLIWARAISVEFCQLARAGLASRTSEPLKVHRSARSYSLLDTGRAPSGIERAVKHRARHQDTERAPSGYPHHWQSNSDFVAGFFSNHE